MVSFFRKLRDTTKLLREHTFPLAHQQGQFVSSGERGDFDVELTIGGLDDERREALIATLSANVSEGRRLAPIGDGRLHLCAQVRGFSLAVAATAALADFGHMLREAGLTDEELLAGEFGFGAIASTEQSDTPAARGLHRYLNERAHGWNVSSADMYDMALRQRHSDREYMVEGKLTGLDDFASLAAAARTREMGNGEPAPISHGALPMEVSIGQVGSGYGALLLATRKLARLLEIAPASASFSISARFVQ
jgi:hypothetical protein